MTATVPVSISLISFGKIYSHVSKFTGFNLCFMLTAFNLDEFLDICIWQVIC
jgi:hypothetical protein